jgi:hypothetical protein
MLSRLLLTLKRLSITLQFVVLDTLLSWIHPTGFATRSIVIPLTMNGHSSRSEDLIISLRPRFSRMASTIIAILLRYNSLKELALGHSNTLPLLVRRTSQRPSIPPIFLRS